MNYVLEDKEWFKSIKETAKILSVSSGTIRTLIKTEKLKAFKVGWQWRIAAGEIERMADRFYMAKKLKLLEELSDLEKTILYSKPEIGNKGLFTKEEVAKMSIEDIKLDLEKIKTSQTKW